jgi:hypothetical protein
MQLLKNTSRPASAGYALIITMCFLAVALITYASMMYWVSTNAHITKRNNLFNQSENAAESATEMVLGAMMRDFYNQSLNPSSTYTSSTNLPTQTNWPVTFQFSDTNGVANATTVYIGPVNWGNLPTIYSGLNGLGQYCEVASVATPQNVGENLSATVDQQLWLGSIPIFQFAIFYNMDMEINPGEAMTVNGRVHSNYNIYASGASSGAPLTFSTNVEAAAAYFAHQSPLDPRGENWRPGNVTFSDTVNNPLSSAQYLSLPIGTNGNNNPAATESLLDVPPAGTLPTSPTGQVYPYNEADIIITNAPSGTNIAVIYQNYNNANPQTLVPMDVTNVVVQYTTNGSSVSSSYVTNTYYSFVTNTTFYDYRESDTVNAIQINVGQFGNWLTNANGGLTYNNLNTAGGTSKGHNIDGVYVLNSVPLSGSQLPGVRVVNGAKLPTADGFTVATPDPLYVEGNYNTTTNNVNYSTTLGDTTNTWPAALMGDAVTVLSSAWNDSLYTSSYPEGSRTPVSTTINAACLEGIVPSNGTYYSGGVENFLRLLENWSGGTTLGYNGSIVVLFPSQYATNFWSNTSYYGVPTRAWGFDNNFKSQSRLPPMTPQLRTLYRTSWTAW